MLSGDQVGDPGDAELLLNTFTGGYDDELAADRAKSLGVAAQHVHERGAKVGAPAQPQDHHRVARSAVRGWELCFEHRRGSEEQAGVQQRSVHGLSRSPGTAALINHALQSEGPRAVPLLWPPMRAQREPPGREPELPVERTGMRARARQDLHL